MKSVNILFFVFLFFISPAQETGELLARLKTTKSDTAKINAFNALTAYYLLARNNDSAEFFNKKSIDYGIDKKIKLFNYDAYHYAAQLKRSAEKYTEALQLAGAAKEIAVESKNAVNEVKALKLAGNIYESESSKQPALENYQAAFDLSNKIKDKKSILLSSLALGLYYKKNDKTTDGLNFLLIALRAAEEIPDSSAIFTCAINLGTLYQRSNDNAKAMAFYKKALIINKRDNDENGTAICSFKIGKLYAEMKKTDSAISYFNETLKIHQKRNDEVGLIFDYSILAECDMNAGKFESSKKKYLQALELSLKHKDSVRISMVYAYIAELNKLTADYKEAMRYYKLSLDYRTPEVIKVAIATIYKDMAGISAKQGLYKDAYTYYVMHKAWSDSSQSISETKRQTELKLAYEFDKVQEKMKEEARVKEKISHAELEKEHLQRNFSLVALALVGLLLIVAVRSYRTKQKANAILEKQKKEIERQKKIVDQKNTEISDSIAYSLRIQTASLPEKWELEKYFPDHSLFFRPKDIVSGDFYWAAQQEDKALIAVADCTGHGVPGAITSMIGSMLLNEIFYVKHLHQPDEVLTELNRLVKLTLRQEADSLSKDGMDISFCQWNKNTNELLYAGANRPVYVVKQTGEVTEYKPTKVSVGGYVPLMQQYDLNKIQLERGDMVVLTSDGYADQFGGNGDKEKKFTTKAFKKFLTGIVHLNPAEKTLALQQNYILWKGDCEQTDDVMVFTINI